MVHLIEEFQEKDKVYMVTKLARGGSLFDWQSRVQNPRLSEPLSRSIFKQVVGAVELIHSNDIVHRDLKHLNILVNGIDPETQCPRVKLTDFGLAVRLKQDEFFTPVRGGTIGY